MGTGLPAHDEMAPHDKELAPGVGRHRAARADLVGRGVEVGAIEDVGGGVKYARLADPDGNTLATGLRRGEALALRSAWCSVIPNLAGLSETTRVPGPGGGCFASAGGLMLTGTDPGPGA